MVRDVAVCEKRNERKVGKGAKRKEAIEKVNGYWEDHEVRIFSFFSAKCIVQGLMFSLVHCCYLLALLVSGLCPTLGLLYFQRNWLSFVYQANCVIILLCVCLFVVNLLCVCYLQNIMWTSSKEILNIFSLFLYVYLSCWRHCLLMIRSGGPLCSLVHTEWLCITFYSVSE